MKKNYIILDELKYNLKQQGIEVRPKYCHEDYMFTSFTMPYPLKNKLDKMCKRYSISRSRLIQIFLQEIDEDKFFDFVRKYK